MPGKIRKERGRRWYIELPGKVKVYCDKEHRSFHSPEHAQWTLAQIQGEIEKGTFDVAFYSKRKKSVHSFDFFTEEWLANLGIRGERGELSRAYVRRVRGHLDRHLRPFFGEFNIREIRGKEITAFYLHLEGSPKTRINIMATLKKIFRDACLEEVIPQMPRFPQLEKVPRKDVPWATEEVQRAVLDFMDDRARYLVQFCIAHGVRTGEARALQHGDIDLERNTVSIRRAFSEQELRPYPKGKRDRTLPLESTWRRTYLSFGRGLPTAFVFTGRNGKPHSHGYAWRSWTKACREAGVKACNFHQGTRHSRLTQLALAGVPGKFLQQFAGHEDAKTTDIYIHMTDVEALRVVLERAKEGTVVPFRKVVANDFEDK